MFTNFIKHLRFSICMISVTDLSSYLYCPRKLYLNKVLGLVEIPKEALVKGNVRHLAHDLANKSEKEMVLSIRSVDEASIFELFSKNYGLFLRDAIKKYKSQLESFDMSLMDLFDTFWAGFKVEAELRASQVYDFARRHNVVSTELWNDLLPKIESELRIQSDTLQLRGIIDRVEVFDDGVVPIELKTGSCPREGVWPGHQIQIAAYMLLLKEKGRKVAEAHVHYLDQNIKRIITLNPFLEDKIKKLIGDVNALLQSKDVPPVCDNDNKCKNCGLKDRCLSSGGSA